jgi:hypothetical protein
MTMEADQKQTWFVRLWNWFWCTGSRKRATADTAAKKLQINMRVTANSRFAAAARLQRQASFAFFTTTLFSLGLIFIPLLQGTGVHLAFDNAVLNMMQIFLAVAVLVYSVVIGTSRYEIRAEKLIECANKLKELTREIQREGEANGWRFEEAGLEGFQTRYTDIVADSENHTRSDYDTATLEMRSDYCITGLPWLTTFLSIYMARSAAYLVPVIMVLAEMIFITDMLCQTSVFVRVLNGDCHCVASPGVTPPGDSPRKINCP